MRTSVFCIQEKEKNVYTLHSLRILKYFDTSFKQKNVADGMQSGPTRRKSVYKKAMVTITIVKKKA